MNIDELQAGRELDQFVAERTLGWSKHYFGRTRLWKGVDGTLNGWSLDEWPKLTQTEIEGGYTRCEFVDMWMPHGVFRPSTDIAAASLVWNALGQNGYSAVLEIGEPNELYARASFNGEIMVSAEAPTAPLAICRAALKAILPIDKV